MKKILLVDRTTPDVGGVRTYISNLKLLLNTMGYEVDVYTTTKNGSFLDQYVIAGIRFLLNRVYRPIGIIADNWLFGFMFNLILPTKYDLYILQQPLYLNTKNKAKSISIVHAVWTDNLQGSKVNESSVDKCFSYEKYLLNKNHDINFTVSENYANYLTERYSLTDSMQYIDNFLAEDFLSESWKERTIDILFTGQFNERKNLYFLLNVVKVFKANNPNKKLNVMLIGDGPLHSKIQEFIQKEELQDLVEIIISPPREEIKTNLANAKIFMLPSLKESFSYSLLEAKLSGCITIATKGLEVPDGFIDYSLGLEDPTDIIEVIEGILNEDFDPNEISKGFVNPIDIAREKFTNLLSRY